MGTRQSEQEPVVMRGTITSLIEVVTDFNFVNPNDPNKGQFKSLGQKIDELLQEADQHGEVREFSIKLPKE